MDQMNLKAWENRVETRHGGLSAQIAGMAQACFGNPGPAPASGASVPPLWHWFAFLPETATGDLGPDGHPPLGEFLPPLQRARRMWAGGALTFHAPLRVDEPLARVSTIQKVTEKEGATGPMVFVTLEHRISGRLGLAITERQDIVYLPIPESYTPPRKQAPIEGTAFSKPVATPPTLLFRYSALTYNAHRIHYDLPYAREVEHYPGLVVHGPLQATLLMAAATEHAGRPPKEFSFRGVHPVFAGEPLRVLGASERNRMTLCTAVEDAGGAHQGMQATAIWEDGT